MLTIFFTGCEQSKKYTDYSFDSFDTVTTIIGFEKSEDRFKDNAKKIKEWLYEYHQLYNIYNSYPNPNLVNVNNSKGEYVAVDEKIIDLLNFSKDMHNLTNGEINIAMGAVLKEWHYCRENGLNDPANAKLPNNNTLKEVSLHTDINNLLIDSENNTVLLKDSNMRLDVGAIAKGYAVQKVADRMQSEGITGYLLNVGGNIKIVGERPDGKKWKVGIENPDSEDPDNPYIEYLSLENISLVTSGSYQRFYSVDNKNYHHIIDKDTLYPADYFLSVSVLCEDSGVADALSTALFCMPQSDGEKLINSLEETEAMWVLKNGTKIYSKNFKNYY